MEREKRKKGKQEKTEKWTFIGQERRKEKDKRKLTGKKKKRKKDSKVKR